MSANEHLLTRDVGARRRASRKPSAWSFAIRFLRREWRSGELHALAASLVIAVGSLTSVGFFADRIKGGMSDNAAELLAADLQVVSPEPISREVTDRARAVGLDTADTLSFRSVLSVGDEFQLAAVKAVGPRYPLRGRLIISDAPFADGKVTEAIPAPGTAWLDARLMATLDLKVGDAITLGERSLDVAKVLTSEPDRGGDMFSIAPRLMLNLSDIPSTGLVQPGSRVRYRLLIAGERADVAAFRDYMNANLRDGQSLRDTSDGRPEMRAALVRAQQFLGLASLVAVLLSGVAIAVAARRYAARHLNSVALFRCLGAHQRWVFSLHVWELVILGSLASLLGVILGYFAQQILASLLSVLFVSELPPPTWRPAVVGAAFGLITLLGFSLPPLMSLARVSPMRVLRQDLPAPATGAVLAYALAGAAMVLIAYWFARDIKLTMYVIGGGIGTMLVLLAAAWVLIRALGFLRGRVGVAWRFGLANIARRGAASHVQVVAFGLGIMALMLLAFVRGDLLNAWQRSLPDDTPNYFLVNVQPHEADAVTDFLTERGVGAVKTFPMIRARLRTVNGRPIAEDDYADPRAQRFATREFNLSHAAEANPRNKIVDGEWWRPNRGAQEFSVEAGFANSLGWSIGDKLEFEIAGERVTGHVSNLRHVQWETFDVNFFVVGSTAMLKDYHCT
ncbi:MAG: FtsX-like permease family protein [Pseudomonadota bacterium]